MKQYPFPIFFDACAFHPPQQSEKAATNKLLELEEKDVITIGIPDKVHEELLRAPQFIAQHSFRIFTVPVNLNAEEWSEVRFIRTLLFGDKWPLATNESNDIDNVFEAQKYGCRYFVTADRKHILSKGVEIKRRFGVRVMLPSGCLNELEKWLARPDRYGGDMPRLCF